MTVICTSVAQNVQKPVCRLVATTMPIEEMMTTIAQVPKTHKWEGCSTHSEGHLHFN